MKMGIAVTMVLSSAVTTMALMGSFFLGVSYGEGRPASHPPQRGEERMVITINTRDGKAAEVAIYETAPGKIYVSSVIKEEVK